MCLALRSNSACVFSRSHRRTIGVNELDLGNELHVVAPFICISATTFRNCTKRTGVTGCYVGANAVGNLQGIRLPEFPRPNKIVAGTRCIIGAPT